MSETVKVTENPKIYAAIAGVIADCGVVGKDKVNKQQGFKYRSVDDVFNALHPALAKNKVVIIPTVIERHCEEVGKTKNGTSILKVICKVKYDICAEDGSHVTSIIYGEGMDMGDKATNKAMAIAYKYLCFQVFCIPTEEMSDPDAESLEGELAGAQKKEEKKVSAKAEDKKSQPEPSAEPKENDKITPVMLTTIQKEQTRTGVTDKQILSMHDVKAKKIEDMTVLSDVENMNDSHINVQYSTSKLGWIKDQFIPYDTEIVFDGDQRFRQTYDSISEHGNWKLWQSHIQKLRKTGRVEIKFMMAASFASVLVSLLGGLPFILDLWGETEGGKTVQ